MYVYIHMLVRTHQIAHSKLKIFLITLQILIIKLLVPETFCFN